MKLFKTMARNGTIKKKKVCQKMRENLKKKLRNILTHKVK